MGKTWKELLLKSGLPFEYEVKQKFVEKGCTVWDEYVYSKSDENNIEKDFSYDLDANYWRGCSIDFMIECKYKTKKTNWFFLPDSYAYQEEINNDDFFYISDFFVHNGFRFGTEVIQEKKYLGPICQKGVEILDNDYIESTIRRAINQVSYAFIEKVIQGIDEQLNIEMFYDTAFVQIPIIITNAELNVIKENISTDDIKNSKTIEEVSEKRNFIIHRRKISSDLKKHNLKRLNEYFSTENKKQYAQKHLKGFGYIDDLIDRLSESPSLVVIMNHSENHDNYTELFDYIDKLLNEKHPDAIKKRMPKPEYIKDVERQLDEILKRRKNNQ